MPAFRERANATDPDVLVFADTEALKALEAITTRRPRLVALERLFAATPRGAALINRIKADPALAGTEIRVLAHDSDYSRVLPRPGGGAAAPSMPAPAPPAGGSQPAATALKDAPATSAATLEPPPLDFGTRYAPRFRVTGKLEMLIDGNPAALVDLSITGAQVVSPTILKPNQRVRLTLSDDTAAIRLNAAIAWAQFEIPAGAPPQYRAGIEFAHGDGAAVGEFCARHRT